MSTDSAIRDHQSWLGYLQPEGLVVSPAALVDAQVILAGNVAAKQHQLLAFVQELPFGEETVPAITSLRGLVSELLEWPEERLAGSSAENPIPESLKIPLRDFGETLEPTFAFQDLSAADQDRPWILLVQEVPFGTPLDAPIESALSGWSASPTRRFERLLRESGVPIGLLSNGTHLQLVYAPRGENAGSLTFPVGAMTEVSGRPILSAFWMLLSRYRLLAAPSAARLPALLKRSRDYQSRVSTALANQVLEALYELLRGFQSANDHTAGELLKDYLENDPDQIYGGLLSVLMRLVFLLYAEDQGLMPDTDLFARNYSLHGLFQRLRNDAEQFPDTMEDRYGAWPQFLALFRAVYKGCQHPLIRMPAREGHLFDPDRYPFLEGRQRAGQSSPDSAVQLPLVPDGVVYRVLEKLLVLDGERLSYKTLDVEQIGSVYETMMGFRLEQATGTTIALRPSKTHGAPVPINLEAVLAEEGKDRKKLIKEQSDYELTASIDNAVKAATSVDELLAALERRIARSATPQPVAIGTMILVPTDERRRSGSHYTPRSLTEPIVRTTLEPIFRQLGENPTPDQILNLKICDPAMGSGAFLVEACRQLAEALVRSWIANGYKPYIPPDEDELLHARRLVAQRCLYGVDRNPMAVDLAKLSLWLVTLAKDHPFTFLDHSLRCGDSLVGLTRRQIIGFHWEPKRQRDFQGKQIEERIQRATSHRIAILNGGDDMLPGMKLVKLQNADTELNVARLMGDACVSAFFAGSKAAERNANVDTLFTSLSAWADNHFHPDHRRAIAEAAQELRTGFRLSRPQSPSASRLKRLPSIPPFHWEIEFPEVFTTDPKGNSGGGFDAIVGNPPFLGGKRISGANGKAYANWICSLHGEVSGNADLVAHFYRRAFALVRMGGATGLIATNSISQGDTRRSGLLLIRRSGGWIFGATRRLRWPGDAAVVVSVVYILKGQDSLAVLDGKPVEKISAYLFHQGGDEDPFVLAANAKRSHIGCDLKGQGFLFDDADEGASSLAEMQRLLALDSRNGERITAYFGGEDLNNSVDGRARRFVINFEEMTAEEAIRWPSLFELVQAKIPQEREGKESDLAGLPFWRFWRPRPDLRVALNVLDRAMAINCGASPHMAFVFAPSNATFAHTTTVIAVEQYSAFAVLQSRVHEIWARFFSSSMKDDLRYTPTDCFETFPFPEGVLNNASCHSQTGSIGSLNTLENVGCEYYEFRAALMVDHNEGLTKTYNRFHGRDHMSTEPDSEKVTGIQRLQELHNAMDRSVLEAYGWHDLAQSASCEFLLDYEDEESEEETSGHKKKPWRYRWPDEFRDEVLARLLALNAQRATEERFAGATTTAAPKRAPKKKATKRSTTTTPSTPAAPKKARKKRAKGDREMF